MSGEERWHGTRGGYIHHRCRCAPCTQANTDYARLHIAEREPAEARSKRLAWHREYDGTPEAKARRRSRAQRRKREQEESGHRSDRSS